MSIFPIMDFIALWAYIFSSEISYEISKMLSLSEEESDCAQNPKRVPLYGPTFLKMDLLGHFHSVRVWDKKGPTPLRAYILIGK